MAVLSRTAGRADLGLTQAYADRTFEPYGCMSRQAAMTILSRFAAERLLDQMTALYEELEHQLAGHPT